MSSRYFGSVRHDVLQHISPVPQHVLEIGCGSGATMGALRERGTVVRAVGVEIDGDAAAAARSHFDVVLDSAINEADIEGAVPPGSLDAILCLDVLEHLVDPWSVVKRITPLLRPGGRLYISLPNIRNWKFIVRLAVSGDFRYRDAGLLDRTHLRFFVRQTACELATCGGLSLASVIDSKAYSKFEFRNILNTLTFGASRDLIAKQWIVIAEQQAGS